jgi:hypothetical protein
VRALVCGGRGYDDADALSQFMDELAQRITIDAVIDGDARGADRMAGEWACRRDIENIKFRAEWEKLGRKAGPIRNQFMLDEGRPDVVVAFPGGWGTADMVRRARLAGVEVTEADVKTRGTGNLPG